MTNQPGHTPESAPEQTPEHSRGAVDLTQVSQSSTSAATSSPATGGDRASWVNPDIADQNQLQQFLQYAQQVPLILFLAAPSNPSSGQIQDVLVSAIDDRAGKMVAGIIDGEAHPELLQLFGVPSGPIVLAVMGGRPMPLIDQPVERTQLDALLDELNSVAVQNGISATVAPLVEPEEDTENLSPLHQQAQDAIAAGDTETAKAAYQQALKDNPADEFASSGLKSIELIERTRDMDAQQARTKAADEPDNIQAQIAVADLDVLGGHLEDGFDRLVRFIASHFGDDRETAREHLVELYSIVGDKDPRVNASRKKLAMALF